VNKPVLKPDFYFRILTESRDKVATLGTYLSGHEIPILYPGTGYIDVDIKSLNIMPDRYFVTIYILSNGIIVDNNPKCYDSIDGCATLNVETSDLYKSGRGIDKWWGVMFLPCEWDFEGLNTT
jgi:hypothetical protein